jgi:hypothetical protein
MKRLSTADIERHFGNAPGEQRQLLLSCRRELLRIVPRCNEHIKWDALSYQKPDPDGAVKGSICQLSIRNGQVMLGFVHGAFLPDPARMLKGTLKAKRLLAITEPHDMRDRRIVDLIKASYRFDPCKMHED